MPNLHSVFGATGQQGGNLIKHILHRPDLSQLYNLRGTTRDVSRPSAIALEESGVEMVQVGQEMCGEGGCLRSLC